MNGFALYGMVGVSSSSHPDNEPVFDYAPSEDARSSLQSEMDRQMSEIVEIPCLINGEEVYTGTTTTQVMPHDHGHVLAKVHLAGAEEMSAACEAAINAQEEWIGMGLESRCAIFERAADLLSGAWRAKANAATMLNQSKTAFQAEVDAACELIDFWRFNAYYARGFHSDLQPLISPQGVVNSTEIRPLEGFVLAVTPFNFTSIAANLPSAPAIVGCTSVWKPSRNCYHSNWVIMQLMMEAGLPPGVINFLPGSGSDIAAAALSNPDLAGVHFTGSTSTFRTLWQDISAALPSLRGYPRIVGETGGKDFVVAHPDCDEQALLVALLRGAFEYQGQKCAAASRAYIPHSVWSRMGDSLIAETESIMMGDPRDFTNFMSAVIDQRAFDKITGYIARARDDPACEIVTGGGSDDSKGCSLNPQSSFHLILEVRPWSRRFLAQFSQSISMMMIHLNKFS